MQGNGRQVFHETTSIPPHRRLLKLSRAPHEIAEPEAEHPQRAEIHGNSQRDCAGFDDSCRGCNRVAVVHHRHHGGGHEYSGDDYGHLPRSEDGYFDGFAAQCFRGSVIPDVGGGRRIHYAQYRDP